MKDVSIIVYTTPDLKAAKQFFGALMGAEPYVDSPYYVGYKNGHMEIGLDPNGDTSLSAGLAYWTVTDIEASVKALVQAGGSVVKEPVDVAAGLLVATVREPNGSLIGLRQPPKE